MGTILKESVPSRLERSCGPQPRDWIRAAPRQAGLERIEAYFSGHAYDPHRHDTYAVGYTLDGVQSFDYRGARLDSTRGHAIVIHPDELHNGRAGAEAGFRYRMLYIEPRLIQDALGERAASLPFVQTAVLTDCRLLDALRLALDDLDRRLEDLEREQIVVAVAQALLALDASARATPSSATCAVGAEKARQFLDEHFGRVVASEELEAVTGLDRYALARHFRRHLGTSPYRYLIMRRLDCVRSCIRAGHSLADTASAAGFADQSHLTRQFKQAYGLSPGRWRAMHAGLRSP